MSSGRIHLESAGGIATVVIDNPGKRNALTSAMRGELLSALQRADRDPAVRVICLTGHGDTFCAGGDINVLRELKSANNEEGFVRLLDEGKAIVGLLRNSMKPTIAIVNGPALGGGFFIALSCDLRLCGASASFGAPLVRLGLGPDWGGTYLLPRLVGSAKALEMLFTGEPVGAEEALRMGLANQVWPDAQLTAAAGAFVRKLAAYPAALLARHKQAIHATWDQTFDQTADLERRLQLLNFRSADFAEGIAAFLEKRPPDFA
jgi:enoyl-CoA hydratase/carnithine racemase